jgi:hypothetical protein
VVRNEKKPEIQIEDMPAAAEPEALTPEQAENAEGGIIAILIGLKSDQPKPTSTTQNVTMGDGSVRF